MQVAWATGAGLLLQVIVTSPTASCFPNFRILASAFRVPGSGLRKKLMFRLVVTASATVPIWPNSAAYMAVSTSVIMVGPEMVPPGRMS